MKLQNMKFKLTSNYALQEKSNFKILLKRKRVILRNQYKNEACYESHINK